MSMARRLLEQGVSVSAHDIDASRESRMQAAGARTGAAALLECPVLAVVTPDEKPLIALLGDLAGSSVRTVLMHSTVLPDSVQALERQLRQVDIDLVDAPVSGGADAARSGSLTILAGGEPEVIDRVAPTLAELGDVHRMGPVGAASAAKLVNQLALFASLAALYEGLSLTRTFGVTDDAVIEAIRASTGDSWAARNLPFFEQLVADYDGSNAPVGARPWRKDLREFELAASNAGLEVPLASLLAHYVGDRLEAEARDQSGAEQ